MALELGVVTDKVLDARPHAPSLHTLNVGHRNARCQVRIFGIALKVAAIER